MACELASRCKDRHVSPKKLLKKERTCGHGGSRRMNGSGFGTGETLVEFVLFEFGQLVGEFLIVDLETRGIGKRGVSFKLIRRGQSRLSPPVARSRHLGHVERGRRLTSMPIPAGSEMACEISFVNSS